MRTKHFLIGEIFPTARMEELAAPLLLTAHRDLRRFHQRATDSSPAESLISGLPAGRWSFALTRFGPREVLEAWRPFGDQFLPVCRNVPRAIYPGFRVKAVPQ
jgi:hypothetical protein